MRHIKHLFFFALTVVLFSACGQQKASETTTNDNLEITLETFKSDYNPEKHALLDVRTTEEYAEGHLEGSNHIDFFNPDFVALVGELDKDKTYYVYCRSGKRSLKATTLMRENGFDNVYSVSGGILAFEEDGAAIVK